MRDVHPQYLRGPASSILLDHAPYNHSRMRLPCVILTGSAVFAARALGAPSHARPETRSLSPGSPHVPLTWRLARASQARASPDGASGVSVGVLSPLAARPTRSEWSIVHPSACTSTRHIACIYRTLTLPYISARPHACSDLGKMNMLYTYNCLGNIYLGMNWSKAHGRWRTSVWAGQHADEHAT